MSLVSLVFLYLLFLYWFSCKFHRSVNTHTLPLLHFWQAPPSLWWKAGEWLEWGEGVHVFMSVELSWKLIEKQRVAYHSFFSVSISLSWLSQALYGCPLVLLVLTWPKIRTNILLGLQEEEVKVISPKAPGIQCTGRYASSPRWLPFIANDRITTMTHEQTNSENNKYRANHKSIWHLPSDVYS